MADPSDAAWSSRMPALNDSRPVHAGGRPMRFINYATFVDDQRKLGDLQPEHASSLASLLAEGKLAAVGSFADGTGELQVYELDSAETAPGVASAGLAGARGGAGWQRTKTVGRRHGGRRPWPGAAGNALSPRRNRRD